MTRWWNHNKHLLPRLDVLLLFISALAFILWPQIDIWLTGLFYQQGFYLAQLPEIEFIYRLFAKIHFLWLLVLIGLIVVCQVFLVRNSKRRDTWLSVRRSANYLLVSILLIPGILVNTVIKNNTIGRARPNDTTLFGGDLNFTAPFTYSGACETNCSFVSGHAAIAFFIIALAWALQDRRWYFIGLAIGSAVGLTRIMQGGHFLSDVIFAFWFVHFGCLWLAGWFRLSPISSSAKKPLLQPSALSQPRS